MTTQSIEQLLHRTSDTLRHTRLDLNSPVFDFEGYWLFAVFDQCTPFQAVKMGFSVGRYEGEDLGVDVPGDPGNVLCVIDLINADGAVSFSTDQLHRSEITTSPDRLDILFGPYGRLRGEWPNLRFRMLAPDEQLEVDLELSGRHVHWWPDLVLPGTFYRQFVCPDMTVRGSVSRAGETQDVSGMGALDRPFGRLVKSPSSRGVGYWHYDVIVWEGHGTTVSWYVTDRQGRPFLGYGMASAAPDDFLLFDRFEIEYLEVEERGGKSLPRRWRGRLSSPDNVLSYEVLALGREFDPNDPDSSFLLPNLLLECEGTLTRAGRKTELKGYGLPEYHVAHRAPDFGLAG